MSEGGSMSGSGHRVSRDAVNPSLEACSRHPWLETLWKLYVHSRSATIFLGSIFGLPHFDLCCVLQFGSSKTREEGVDSEVQIRQERHQVVQPPRSTERPNTHPRKIIREREPRWVFQSVSSQGWREQASRDGFTASLENPSWSPGRGSP